VPNTIIDHYLLSVITNLTLGFKGTNGRKICSLLNTVFIKLTLECFAASFIIRIISVLSG